MDWWKKQSRKWLAMWVAAVLLIGLLPVAGANAAVSGFVTRSGSQLQLGGAPFRIAGTNIYWLGLDENVGGVDYPTEYRVNNALDTASEMGINVVRTHAANSFGCAKCIMPSLNNYNEEAFRKLDYAVKAAGDRGIRLILPLVDQYNYYHGGKKTWTVKWFGYPDDGHSWSGYEFFTDPAIIAAFKNHLNVLLNRVNTYTGVAYKNDPAIMAWETGNELLWVDNPQAFKNWTQNIADYIKSVDNKHLVVDGAYGVQDTHLPISSIDMYSDHFYEWPAYGSCCKGLSVSQLNSQAAKTQAAGKAFFVGEYAWNLETYGTMTSFINAVKNNSAIAGSAFWSLFGHKDNYGYVQHNDGFTLHYPGDTADMRTKAQQLRTHNYQIRGLSVPSHGIPPAPKIVSHDNNGGKNRLYWQGAAGADKYTVERSTAGSSGPWTVISNQGATDYSTPWTDSGSAYGTAAWYRLKAHNLSGAAGSYSAVYATGGTTPPSTSTVIDDFEGYGGSNAALQAAYAPHTGGNAATVTLSAGTKDAGSYGLKYDYTVNSPNYVGKLKAVNADWSGKAGIQLWVKPDGKNRSFTVQFKEAGGEYWESRYALSGTAAVQLQLPFSGFIRPSWSSGNGVMELGNITEFNLYIDQGSGSTGSGSLYFDSIGLYTGDTQAPTAPSGLSSPSKTTTSVQLSWTASTDNVGVTAYDIYRGAALAGSTGGTSYNATGLTPGTSYSFTVKARDAAGNVSAASNTLTVTTNAAPAAVVDNFEGYGGSDSSLQSAYVPNASGNSITPTLSSSVKADGSYGMKLDYTIGSPNYAGVIHTLNNANWSGKSALKLWLKPDSSNRQLAVQIKESSGEYWEGYATLSGSTGGIVSFAFSSLTRPSWYSGGNGVFDPGSIAELNFYINQGSGGTGSSAIYLDSITVE